MMTLITVTEFVLKKNLWLCWVKSPAAFNTVPWPSTPMVVNVFCADISRQSDRAGGVQFSKNRHKN